MKLFDPPCRNTEICPPWKSCLECEWRVCVSSTDALVFVFLFGQRFLDNPRADLRQSLHAGVLWFRMCLLPFWGLASTGGGKGGNEIFYGSQWGIFAFWWFLSDISATRARIHTKFYLCRDNVCLRAPSRCGVQRPLGRGWRGS